jgi:hypothetical protein
MSASNRSIDPVWAPEVHLGGDAWLTSQLPPATSQPPVAPTRPTSPLGEPGLGGLLVSFGDALGG